MDQQPLSHIDPMSGRDPHFAQCSAVTVLELLIILSLNCVLSTALVNVFALKKKNKRKRFGNFEKRYNHVSKDWGLGWE